MYNIATGRRRGDGPGNYTRNKPRTAAMFSPVLPYPLWSSIPTIRFDTEHCCPGKSIHQIPVEFTEFPRYKNH